MQILCGRITHGDAFVCDRGHKIEHSRDASCMESESGTTSSGGRSLNANQRQFLSRIH